MSFIESDSLVDANQIIFHWWERYAPEVERESRDLSLCCEPCSKLQAKPCIWQRMQSTKPRRTTHNIFSFVRRTPDWCARRAPIRTSDPFHRTKSQAQKTCTLTKVHGTSWIYFSTSKGPQLQRNSLSPNDSQGLLQYGASPGEYTDLSEIYIYISRRLQRPKELSLHVANALLVSIAGRRVAASDLIPVYQRNARACGRTRKECPP